MSEIVLTYGDNVLEYGNNIPTFDLFSGAFAIYSVRKVIDSYSGPAMRVVRSDLSEQDIGFVGNDLDTQSLIDFANGTTGYANVLTWYDQSGNGRNTTSPNSSSMEIIAAGVVHTRNGKPALKSSGPSIALSLSQAYNLGTKYSFFGVVEWSVRQREWLGGGSNIYGIYQENGATYSSGLNGTYFAGTGVIPLDVNKVAEVHRTDLTVQTFYNNIDLNMSTIGVSNLDFILTNLNGENTTYGLVGYLQETIIFTANRVAIRSQLYENISNYFG